MSSRHSLGANVKEFLSTIPGPSFPDYGRKIYANQNGNTRLVSIPGTLHSVSPHHNSVHATASAWKALSNPLLEHLLGNFYSCSTCTLSVNLTPRPFLFISSHLFTTYYTPRVMLCAGYLSQGHFLVYELRESWVQPPFIFIVLELHTVSATRRYQQTSLNNTCMHHADATNTLSLYVCWFGFLGSVTYILSTTTLHCR